MGDVTLQKQTGLSETQSFVLLHPSDRLYDECRSITLKIKEKHVGFWIVISSMQFPYAQQQGGKMF